MTESDIQAIYLVLHAIPKGKVATYGQIASVAGLPGKARMIGKLLSQLPEGSKIPWHRVINAAGKISFPEGSDGYAKQKKRLVKEGIVFKGQRINLKDYQWQH